MWTSVFDWLLPAARQEKKTVDGGSALLRIVGILCVVLLHMKSYFHMESSDVLSRQVLSVVYACCFWAVPAFVVLSGYHVISNLDTIDVGEYYRKRVARLAAKAFFWGAFFTLVCSVIGHGMSSWWHDWLRCRPFFHLWFVFMLVGLYALAPICSKALANVYVMAGAVVVQVFVMVNPVLFDSPFWQCPALISLPYVVPFLLGGLVARCRIGRRLGRISVVVSVNYFAIVAFVWLNDGKLGFYPVCHYLGFFGLMGGLSAVVSLLYVGKSFSPKACIRLFRVSRLVFGVYVVHPLVMTALLKVFPLAFSSGAFGVALGWACVCLASFVLVALMLKVPLLRRFL